MVCTDSLSEVLVLGGGPAGLSLAAELGARGVEVAVLESHPERPWKRSYGAWAVCLPPGLVDEAVAARFEEPRVTFEAGDTTALRHAYVRFDTPRLQALLQARAVRAGVRLVRGHFQECEIDRADQLAHLRDEHGLARTLRARVVINCTGRPLEPTPAPARQSAFGAWFEVDDSPFAPGTMSLMDFRPSGMEPNELHPASFLYAMPERPGVLFAQETIVASRRAAPMRVLKQRLLTRLCKLGIPTHRSIATERCVIPLGFGPPRSSSPVLAFGAAAGMVQPSSGYSLARCLRLAPRVAEALSRALEARDKPAQALAQEASRAVWPTETRYAWALHRFGLETLLGLQGSHLDAFWRAFFDLPGETVPHFMDGGLDGPGVARAMWRVFRRLPQRVRFDVVRGGARFIVQPTAQPGVS